METLFFKFNYINKNILLYVHIFIYCYEMHDEAPSCSTITKYIRSQSFALNISIRTHIIKRADLYKVQKIEKSLKKNPDLSVHEIAADTKLPPSTVYFILTIRMNYKSMLLQKVPHELTRKQKSKEWKVYKHFSNIWKLLKKVAIGILALVTNHSFFGILEKKEFGYQPTKNRFNFQQQSFFQRKR